MSRTLRPSLEMPSIFLYREPVDFRLGFRGLSALVEQELKHNPFEGWPVRIHQPPAQQDQMPVLPWNARTQIESSTQAA